MQIKITMRYHLTAVRMTVIIKTRHNNILDIDRGNGTSQETQKGMARDVPRELGENDAAEIMKM